MGKHPVARRIWSAGSKFRSPSLEFIKRQLQLQQQASALARVCARHFHVAAALRGVTPSAARAAGLFRPDAPPFIASPRRRLIRFFAFEQLSAASRRAASRRATTRRRTRRAASAPGCARRRSRRRHNQAISTKMFHDWSRRLAALPQLFHATRSIYAEHGFWRGFFCGLEPAVIKGAATNCIRFPTLARSSGVQRRDGADPARAAAAFQAIVAGGLAGAISAVVTQPIDTVMAQAQGLEVAVPQHLRVRARHRARRRRARAVLWAVDAHRARLLRGRLSSRSTSR